MHGLGHTSDYLTIPMKGRRRREGKSREAEAELGNGLNKRSDPGPSVMPSTYELITTLIIPQTLIVIPLVNA